MRFAASFSSMTILHDTSARNLGNGERGTFLELAFKFAQS
jgi:hypothetical protein